MNNYIDDATQKKIIAQNLNYYISINNCLQKDVATKIGIKPATFSTYCTGTALPPLTTLSRIANFFQIELSDLVNVRNNKKSGNKPEFDGIKIPVLGYVAAGVPILEMQDILDYILLPEQTARSGDYFGLKIKGNSMEPRICDGDVVIVRSQPDIESGDIAIVSVSGEFGTCKRVKKTDSGIYLIGLNPSFDPVFYTNKEVSAMPVTILGKVVELRAKL
jgi:repressor LexA